LQCLSVSVRQISSGCGPTCLLISQVFTVVIQTLLRLHWLLPTVLCCMISGHSIPLAGRCQLSIQWDCHLRHSHAPVTPVRSRLLPMSAVLSTRLVGAAVSFHCFSLKIYLLVFFVHQADRFLILIDCTATLKHHIRSRDGRISDPAIRIRPDFHYPAKSDSGRIACLTPDRIGANYCVNLSQTICRCSRLVCLCRVVSKAIDQADKCVRL